MKLTCNIDVRGARLRRVWGVLCILTGAVLAGMAWAAGPWWLWIIAGAAVAAGAFALFEARKKWCAMRALGVKTPM
jgi:hypothetical protein